MFLSSLEFVDVYYLMLVWDLFMAGWCATQRWSTVYLGRV